LRVFIPLENNPQAFHSDESGVFQMEKGEIWSLDAGINHAAVNFSNKSRMFLCLDYMFPQPQTIAEVVIDRENLQQARADFIIDLPKIPTEDKEIMVSCAATLISKYTFKDILFLFSKLHFIYDIPVQACYDWLIEAADLARNDECLQKAIKIREYLTRSRGMGERLLINDWPE
jgi:hypothetical protein